MRSFASLAILALAASVSANSAADPFAEVKSEISSRPADIFDHIDDQTTQVIKYSQWLGEIGSEISNAVTSYGDDFQKKAAQREAMAAKYGDKVATEQEQKLRDLSVAISEAKAEHERAKQDLFDIENTLPSLRRQKWDNDITATKKLKLLNVAAADMKKANAVVAQVESMLKSCSGGTAPPDLAAAMEKMRATATAQSQAISDAQKDIVMNTAEAKKFADLKATFSQHSKFAASTNELMGEKRVRGLFLLEEASSANLRANAGSRARVRAPEDTAKAVQSMEALRDSIAARGAEIRAGLEKLSTVKYTNENIPRMVTREEKAAVERNMKSFDTRTKILGDIKTGTKSTEAKALKEAKLGETEIQKLKRQIQIQERDIAIATSKADESKSAADEALSVANADLAKAKQCKAEADRIKVELAALECIESATDKVLGKEMSDAEANRAASAARMTRLEKQADAASSRINLHLGNNPDPNKGRPA